MRITALDCETSPATFIGWPQIGRPTTVSLDQLIEPSRLLCFVAQERGKRIEFLAEWQDGGHERMVREAHRILDEADVVVHFNGRSFDERWFNTEFVRAGLTPPSPYFSVDLFQVSKRFYLHSHKLQHVSTHLVDAGGKVAHTGLQLWKDVMAGDAKARRLMEKYNRGDVAVLWKVMDQLLPWIKMPNALLHGAPEGACTRCASTDVERRGYATLLTGTYARFRCRTCGGWFRGTQRQGSAQMVQVAS